MKEGPLRKLEDTYLYMIYGYIYILYIYIFFFMIGGYYREAFRYYFVAI